MNKLELAHEYAKVLLQQPVTITIGEVVSISFGLAEEMLAEDEKRKDKSRPEVLDKWQPDWSQAPDWANWWAMDRDRRCNWHKLKPSREQSFSEWIVDFRGNGPHHFLASPSFGFDGDWKDSLRKRP